MLCGDIEPAGGQSAFNAPPARLRPLKAPPALAAPEINTLRTTSRDAAAAADPKQSEGTSAEKSAENRNKNRNRGNNWRGRHCVKKYPRRKRPALFSSHGRSRQQDKRKRLNEQRTAERTENSRTNREQQNEKQIEQTAAANSGKNRANNSAKIFLLMANQQRTRRTQQQADNRQPVPITGRRQPAAAERRTSANGSESRR